MCKYALIVTADSRLLPGVHAMLNASKYYGFDDIEFHLLYWPGKEMEQFLAEMKDSGHYPNFKPVNLVEYYEREGEGELGYKPKYYLKFYRSLYASRMVDFDAVGFMDADMVIVGDISPYFKLAHEADRICMVDWKYNQKRVDSDWYKTQGAEPGVHCTSGCPYDPCATFFPPKTWGKYFVKIRDIGRQIGRSEMPSMNYMIIHDNLLEEIIRLPSIRWTQRHWGEVSTEWENPQGYGGENLYEIIITEPDRTKVSKPFCMSFKGNMPDDSRLSSWARIQDLMYNCTPKHKISGTRKINTMLSIHGRWHFRQVLQQKPCQGQNLQRHRALEQNQNIANIWKAFKFFNFCCYTRLNPWKEEWGSPNEYIEVESGLLLKDESKEVVI